MPPLIFATRKSASSGSSTTCCPSLPRWKMWPCRCSCAALKKQKRRRKRCTGWTRSGWRTRSHHRAGELSGGEQQRAALARALITKPKILLADEPTGDLDNRTGEVVFELISRLHREYQLSSVVATHNLGFARRCHRVLRLESGKMEEVAAGDIVGLRSIGLKETKEKM